MRKAHDLVFHPASLFRLPKQRLILIPTSSSPILSSMSRYRPDPRKEALVLLASQSLLGTLQFKPRVLRFRLSARQCSLSSARRRAAAQEAAEAATPTFSQNCLAAHRQPTRRLIPTPAIATTLRRRGFLAARPSRPAEAWHLRRPRGAASRPHCRDCQ